MKIQLNGQEREFSDHISLAILIAQLGMKEDRVAVELNHSIVPRDLWLQTSLAEGDRLEVVHFVGGGAADQLPRQFLIPQNRALQTRPKRLRKVTGAYL